MGDLGYTSKAQAQARLSALGRNGEMPWVDAAYARSLAYLRPGGVVLVPVAHCLLRGLTRNLILFVLHSKAEDYPADHEYVFNSKSKRFIEVCAAAVAVEALMPPLEKGRRWYCGGGACLQNDAILDRRCLPQWNALTHAPLDDAGH